MLGSLTPCNFYKLESLTPPTKMRKLTDVDIVILDILKNDASRSLKDISTEMNLPLTTIHARIQKLKKDGIIRRFTIETEDIEEGFETIILISPRNYEEITKIAQDDQVFATTGEYELMVKKRFKNLKELNEYTTNISKHSKNTNTLIITKKVN